MNVHVLTQIGWTGMLAIAAFQLLLPAKSPGVPAGFVLFFFGCAAAGILINAAPTR